MCPSERRDVAQELWRAVKPGAFSCRNGLPEMLGVPVDDDGRQQVQPCHAVVLTFDGPIADFALPPDAQGVLEGMMSFALVQTDLGTALHVCIEQHAPLLGVDSGRGQDRITRHFGGAV